MITKKKNLVEDFTIALSKIEAIEFLGVCKILGIPLVYMEDSKNNKKGEPREFRDLLWELIQKYSTLNRKQKKELLKLVAGASKKK